MAQFTRLDATDIVELARCFQLGEIREVVGIDAGTINSNYRIVADSGVFFARINEGKTMEDVAYEAELVTWLGARGIPTPRVLPARDGRSFARLAAGLVTVFPWVGGVHRERGAIVPADLHQLGIVLARMHLAGQGFPRRRSSRYGFDQIAARLFGIPPAPQGPLAEALACAQREVDWLAGCAAGRAELPAAVIHGDLFPDNVLFEGTRLEALLDFEQAADGTAACDLAVCLCAWCFDDELVPVRARALRDGYESVRPLMPEESAGLFVEARAAALRFTVTRITDVELCPSATAAARAAKSYRRFHARMVHLRELGPDGFARVLRD